MPSNQGLQLCQLILKSISAWRSYTPDKLTLAFDLCDLDLWATDLGLAHDTPSHHGKPLCQVISNPSIHEEVTLWTSLFLTFGLLNVTLTFDLLTWVLCVICRLTMINKCASINAWESYGPDKIGPIHKQTKAPTYTKPPFWQLCWARRKRAGQKPTSLNKPYTNGVWQLIEILI